MLEILLRPVAFAIGLGIAGYIVVALYALLVYDDEEVGYGNHKRGR